MDEQRYHRWIHDIRCMVCQNQSIAESQSPLASDLRLWVRMQLEAGETDQAMEYTLIQRYGESVLYRPPLMAETSFLWVAPIMILCGILFFWWRRE